MNGPRDTTPNGTANPTDHSASPVCVVPLARDASACDVFRALYRLPYCVFLDSASIDSELGRFSFVAADPFHFITHSHNATEGFDQLSRVLAAHRTPTLPDLPPLQGGAIGLIGYEAATEFEAIGRARYDEFAVPSFAVGLYDVIVAIDHARDEGWIISQGFPETDPSRRRDRAASRAQQFAALIRNGQQRKGQGHDTSSMTESIPRRNSSANIAVDQLAPQFAVPLIEGLTSSLSRDSYLRTIARVVEYIHAGDVFQVNIAQRLLRAADCDSANLYLRLRERNPAPFAGYFDLGDFQVLSASPERFFKVSDRRVESRPIKGTRRRTTQPEADLFAADDLRQSEKDLAENVMIVDLMRNDLARVCQPESVIVRELCRLERYAYVQHLVSIIDGTLRDDVTPLELLRSAFPGGSVTGAPKVRAMQIIAELEPTARGPYCGSLGYVGFDGAMDTNILIRTITAGKGWWQAPVGGGIVAQSDPRDEYDETWHKAEGLLRAMLP